MQEIEAKAKVNSPQELISKLEGLGCKLSDPIIQKDRIFVPQGVVAIPVPNGTNVLRIREQNDHYLFTLKQPISNQLDCIEHELTIDNPKTMVSIIELLGFHEISSVSKKRRKCKYQDIEICLDEVDQLGTYIEVEKMTEKEKGVAVQKELFSFLQKLGISETDRTHDGYDILIAKLKK
ncbi:hypothetical protein A2841_02310 [Candidatus Kaiserbacteria bacterium RIFCSPHIGHO2_01_FULL_48_10]|uniref:CYTH domain-containing protein n=1 Tax=Candidatus Kaiserbacteria bacterium RIFCSPHIGHO2_01_FULL_48_10 TaxID=1798476 RepID=A0A1F6C6M4_9BACT|nr:MAG: hypothetical protein A2841_02310 [Candidatus Kaiserbacteria bacterium RIFCSPHIGHO2_01_FULL_48_10]